MYVDIVISNIFHLNKHFFFSFSFFFSPLYRHSYTGHSSAGHSSTVTALPSQLYRHSYTGHSSAATALPSQLYRNSYIGHCSAITALPVTIIALRSLHALQL